MRQRLLVDVQSQPGIWWYTAPATFKLERLLAVQQWQVGPAIVFRQPRRIQNCYFLVYRTHRRRDLQAAGPGQSRDPVRCRLKSPGFSQHTYLSRGPDAGYQAQFGLENFVCAVNQALLVGFQSVITFAACNDDPAFAAQARGPFIIVAC